MVEMKPHSILIIASTFHPSVGGAESYAFNLARGLARRRHRVRVLTDRRDPALPHVEDLDGFTVHRASSFWNSVIDPDRVRWEQLYFALLDDEVTHTALADVDIIHSNSHETAILGSMAAQAMDVPFVASYHEQTPERGLLGSGRCRLIYGYLPIDAFIVGSRFYYEKAVQFGTQPTRLHLVYHGIDTHAFRNLPDRRQARTKLRLPLAGNVVVCAARLTERKGLLDLIEASVLLHRRGHRFHLRIAGSTNSSSRTYADARRGCYCLRLAAPYAADRSAMELKPILDGRDALH